MCVQVRTKIAALKVWKIRMPLQKVVHPIAFAIPTSLKPVFVLQTRQLFRFTLTASANQLKIKKEKFWWKVWEGFSFVPYYLPVWLWWNASLRINSQVSTGMAESGSRGAHAPHPQILADQLTLSESWRADSAHHTNTPPPPPDFQTWSSCSFRQV